MAKNNKGKRLTAWSDLVNAHCFGCIHVRAVEEVVTRERGGKLVEESDVFAECSVFLKLYFEMGYTDCKAFCDDLQVELRRIDECMKYCKDRTGIISTNLYEEKRRRTQEAATGKFAGLREVYNQELHKPTKKFGGGEKKERTHKGGPKKKRSTMNDADFNMIGKKWWQK